MKWGGSGYIPIINHPAELQFRLHRQEFTAAERLDLGEAFRVSVEIIYPFSGSCVKCKLNLSALRPLISPQSHLNPPNFRVSPCKKCRVGRFPLVAAVSLWSFKVLTFWLCRVISPPYPFTLFRCLPRILLPCWIKWWFWPFNAAGWWRDSIATAAVVGWRRPVSCCRKCKTRLATALKPTYPNAKPLPTMHCCIKRPRPPI